MSLPPSLLLEGLLLLVCGWELWSLHRAERPAPDSPPTGERDEATADDVRDGEPPPP